MSDSIAGAAGGEPLACGQNRGRDREHDRVRDREQVREQAMDCSAWQARSSAVQKARPAQPAPSESEDGGAAETAYLLASPANAERLMASIRQVEAGLARERELIRPDEEEA